MASSGVVRKTRSARSATPCGVATSHPRSRRASASAEAAVRLATATTSCPSPGKRERERSAGQARADESDLHREASSWNWRRASAADGIPRQRRRLLDRPDDRPRDYLRRERADGRDERRRVQGIVAGREREDDVAVEHRVRGRIARARPSCAICATLFAPAFVSRADVATTPMVVLPTGKGPSGAAPATTPAASHLPAGVRVVDVADGVDGDDGSDDDPIREPRARRAEPSLGSARRAESLADRRPRCRADRALGEPAARGKAGTVACRGARPGADAEPTPRSKRTAAGTIGTLAAPAAKPIPRSSRYRTTPSAAASPKALPPVRRTACTTCTRFSGRSRSVSRVPGAEPRTWISADCAEPGQRTTVRPVAPTRSVSCPTVHPGRR